MCVDRLKNESLQKNWRDNTIFTSLLSQAFAVELVWPDMTKKNRSSLRSGWRRYIPSSCPKADFRGAWNRLRNYSVPKQAWIELNIAWE